MIISPSPSGTSLAEDFEQSFGGIREDVFSASESLSVHAGRKSATAAEQQGSATREIAENATQASTGTKRVSEGVGGVNQATHETG